MTSKIQWVALVAVAIIVIASCLLLSTKSVFSAAATDIQNTVYSGIVAGQLFIGGTTNASAVGQAVSAGSCNTGIYAASTTLFGVQSPFSATSTATLIITGLGQATTSTLTVGTSTVATGQTSTSVSATLANEQIATTSTFTSYSGITVGSVGYVNPGAGTFRTIQVGPSDFVVGQATSTATLIGATNYTPGLTCTYKILWSI